MSFGDFLGKVLGGGTGQGVMDFFKRRAELKQQLELAKIQGEIEAEKAWHEWRIANITADAAWEQAQIQNSGWKDEYVLVLLSIPLILVFIPWTASYVMDGFGILEQTPQWYRWLVMVIFGAIYGVRIWRRPLSKDGG